jgi:3-deoxy-D-manno-octulosonic-acid transferase
LLPFGAQNMIEACAAGCPVLLGPHVFNFAEPAQLALDSGAAMTIGDADDLLNRAYQLLIGDKRAPGEKSDKPTPQTRATMAAAAKQFALAHQGATRKTVQWIAASAGAVNQRVPTDE